MDWWKVCGGPEGMLTNLVRLVRYAVRQEEVSVRQREVANARFARWLSEQETRGRRFTPEQRQWLEAIRDHVAANLDVEADDLDFAPFSQRGGLGKASLLFGDQLGRVLSE